MQGNNDAPQTSTLKKISQKTKSLLDLFGLPDMLLLRVAAVYLFAFADTIRILRKNLDVLPVENWKDFIQNLPLGSVILIIVSGFAMLTALHCLMPKNMRIIDPVAAIVSMLYFDVSLLWKQGDFYLSLGVMVVSLVVIGYALSKADIHLFFDKFHWSISGVTVLLMTALVTAFIIIGTICRHKNFGSTTHDFGLFVQMFHSLAEDLSAVTSMERDKFLSHFEVHASYIFYLLVPIFKLFPREETLLVAQAVLAMSGIVPLFLIAKNRGFKGMSLTFICGIYVFSTALIAPCFYDFHENAFLPPLLMWTLLATEKKKALPFYLFSVLTCIVKEDAPLFIICIGLYWFFEHKGSLQRLHGLVCAACSGIYMLLITSWLTAHGDGKMMTSSRFGHLLINPEGGLAEVVINSLSNPGYLLSMLVNKETFVFFIQVMLPLFFLPLFTKKIHRLLLIVPFIITNLVIGTNYGYASNIEYQYIFGPATLLIFMTLINVSDFPPRIKQDLPILLGSAALIMSMGTMSHHLNKIEDYQKNSAYLQSLEETLDSLPRDAVIGGDPFLLPHIADYKEVYIFDFGDVNKEENTLTEPYRYDFIVLKEDSEIRSFAEPLLYDAGYIKTETEVSERIAIYKSPHYNNE